MNEEGRMNEKDWIVLPLLPLRDRLVLPYEVFPLQLDEGESKAD